MSRRERDITGSSPEHWLRKGRRVFMPGAGAGTVSRVHAVKPPANPEWCDVTWDVVNRYPPRVWHPVRYLYADRSATHAI